MSQPPSRPWFRLASIMRPPPPPPPRAPTPAPVQAPQPFRPQIPLPQAGQATTRPPAPPMVPAIPPRTSAPPSPVPQTTTPATVSPPTVATPPPPQPTAPPSPAKTPPPSKDSFEPTSPITKTSSPMPVSPGQKVSSQVAATRPNAAYSSLPSSPKAKPSAPPPSPLQNSPDFKTVPPTPAPLQPFPVAPVLTVTTPAISPMASRKIDKPWVETPPKSTKDKILSHPPSPLTLPPPAQIKYAGSTVEPIPAEIEQKTVLLLQETQEKSKTTPKITANGYMLRSHGETHSNNNGITAQHGKREPKKEKGVHAHKKHSDSEELGARVVTLAGENKGAIMELSPSRKKNGLGGAWSSNGGQKLKSDSEEGRSGMKDEIKRKTGMPTETAPMDAFINCNVQGVNNSILYNCSCTHNDPGVHLSVSRKSNGGGHGVHH